MSAIRWISKHWFLAFVLVTIGLCLMFGGRTVKGWYGGAVRATVATTVYFVRGL